MEETTENLARQSRNRNGAWLRGKWIDELVDDWIDRSDAGGAERDLGNRIHGGKISKKWLAGEL